MAEFPVKDEDIRALRYDVLRALGTSRYPKEAIVMVAGNRGLKVDDVQALVSGYGWPDPDKMRIRAQQMEGKTPTPAALPRPADPLQVLLGLAAKSPRARTVRLAARAQALVTELHGLVEAEAAERKAAAKAAEEKARLKAELKQLEAQVAATRAALGKQQVTKLDGRENAKIRAWAKAQGIEVAPRGRLSPALRAAYDEAQEAAS